jgi:hypothetical protein
MKSAGRVSRYAYVVGDPVTFVDPPGMSSHILSGPEDLGWTGSVGCAVAARGFTLTGLEPLEVGGLGCSSVAAEFAETLGSVNDFVQ